MSDDNQEETTRIVRVPVAKSAPAQGLASPTAGVRRGAQSLFVKDEALPRLDLNKVRDACTAISAGQSAYRGILYLSRAGIDDVDTLFTASQSAVVQERWQRLWVLSPFITKLSRSPQGRAQILKKLNEDLPAMNLLSKFEAKRHASVRRLFSRMHDDLLGMMLPLMARSKADPRRAGVLAKIVEVIETDEGVLRTCGERVLSAADLNAIVPLLVIRSSRKVMSTEALRDKLVGLGPAFGDSDEDS